MHRVMGDVSPFAENSRAPEPIRPSARSIRTVRTARIYLYESGKPAGDGAPPWESQ
jgi:hypothetical protein